MSRAAMACARAASAITSWFDQAARNMDAATPIAETRSGVASGRANPAPTA
ncbi:hypothetical protein ACNF49_02260 [Actinomadura sp. ATCC 39365]